MNASLQGNEAGLVAYYRLDDNSAAIADATGHGDNGALNAGAIDTWQPSGATINTVHALPPPAQLAINALQRRFTAG